MAARKRFPYKAAFVACSGGCRATAECVYGCVGCELCVAACKFDAIHLNEYGVAEVDESKCVACGACARECPRELIRIHDCANPVLVKCSNRDPGKLTRVQCQVGCIGCGLCERICPSGAAKVTDNLSRIDESLCLSCGLCAEKCPRHCICDLRGIFAAKR
jgi:electron transport complex protein RnfB